MYCSDDWNNSSQSSAWNFNVDVPGYGSGGAASTSGSKFASRASFCADKSADFTQTDKVALYRLQGDEVLVTGFVNCIKTIYAPNVYSVSAASVGDDVTLTIQPNLSANAVERVTSVAILSGATAKEGVAIAPGTPLVGHNSIVGGYTLTAPQATFIVKTSTGDQSVSVKRCRTGTPAGSFQVRATTYSNTLSPAGKYVKDVPFGPAGCHPHCKTNAPPNPDSGDMILQIVSGPPDVVLKNLQYSCVGAGCPFADSWDVKLLDDHQIKLAFRNRSAPIMVHLEADQYQPAQVGSEQTLANGAVTFGQEFSVTIPKNSTAAYLVRGGVITPLDKLVDGAPYKVIAAKVAVGDSLVWTLRLDDAACTQ